MTTPERLRRRQRIEGSFLALVGVAMLLQSFYFHRQDDGQRECLQENFEDLAYALDARSDLTDRETAAARKVNLAELEANTEEEFVEALRAYEAEIDAIEEARRRTPLPPFPPGRCS